MNINRRSFLKLFGYGAGSTVVPLGVSALFNEEVAQSIAGKTATRELFDDLPIRINTSLGPLLFKIKTHTESKGEKIIVYAVEDLHFVAKKELRIESIEALLDVPGIGNYTVTLEIQPVDVGVGDNTHITWRSDGIIHLV